MEINIRKGNTGIHNYLDLEIKNPNTEDLQLIKTIIEFVDKYNDEEVRLA